MCCDGRHIKFPDGSTHKLAFIDISEIIADKYIIQTVTPMFSESLKEHEKTPCECAPAVTNLGIQDGCHCGRQYTKKRDNKNPDN